MQGINAACVTVHNSEEMKESVEWHGVLVKKNRQNMEQLVQLMPTPEQMEDVDRTDIADVFLKSQGSCILMRGPIASHNVGLKTTLNKILVIW